MTMEYRFLKLKKEIKDSINKFGSTFYYKFYNSNKDKTFVFVFHCFHLIVIISPPHFKHLHIISSKFPT